MNADGNHLSPGFAFEAMKYPIVRGGALWIAALALLELLPYGGSISWVLTMGVSIAIIKSSLWGGDSMPRLGDFLPAGEFLSLFAKGLAATLVVLWPITLIQVIKFGEIDLAAGLTLLLFLAIFFFLYFLPAALVAVARGDALAEAVTPVLLKQVIKEKGEPYRQAALMLCVLGFFLVMIVAMVNAIPLVGAVLGRALTIWFQFIFARTFGVFYLLPRAQRVARRRGAGVSDVATPEDEPAPAA